MYYVLNENREPVPATPHEWADMFGDFPQRKVDSTTFHSPAGVIEVSTVFLGIDHGFGAPGGPVLFETMIFGGEHAQDYQRRYRTWAEAETGHAEAVAMWKARYVKADAEAGEP